MTDAVTALHPVLHIDGTLSQRPPLPGMASDLTRLERAAKGEVLGFALMHGIGARYIGGSVTEVGCAFLGTGDGESCDGAVITMNPRAHAVLDALRARWLARYDLARLFERMFELGEGEFETLHFRHFTVLMIPDVTNPQQVTITELRIFVDPPATRRDAEQRLAEMQALFRFLCAWHTTLSKYRVELPGPERLLGAA